jgi:hypothetical protein
MLRQAIIAGDACVECPAATTCVHNATAVRAELAAQCATAVPGGSDNVRASRGQHTVVVA